MSMQKQTLEHLSARFHKGWADLEQTIVNNASADCDRTGGAWGWTVRIEARRQIKRAAMMLETESGATKVSAHYCYWLGYRKAAEAIVSGNLPFPKIRRTSVPATRQTPANAGALLDGSLKV